MFISFCCFTGHSLGSSLWNVFCQVLDISLNCCVSFMQSFIEVISLSRSLRPYTLYLYTHVCVCKLFQTCLTLCDSSPQAPLSKGFSRQECWRGDAGSSRDLPHPGIKPSLLHCKRIPHCLSHQGNLSHADGCVIIFQYCYFHLSFMNGL